MTTPAPKQGHHIGYAVEPDGYQVIVYDAESQPLHEYRAGNHPLDSQSYLPTNSPHRVRKLTLLKWAKQTAGELAAEWHVEPGKIFRDVDNETEARAEYEARR